MRSLADRWGLGLLAGWGLLGCASAPGSPGASPAPAASASPVVPVVVHSDPVPAGTFVFYEDFESGFGRWELGQGGGGLGFHALNAPTCGGMWTVSLGLTGHVPFRPAPAEAAMALRTPLDLTRARRPYLKFDVKGLSRPEEALGLQAEVKDPGGVWVPVGRRVTGRYVFVASIGADLTRWAGGRLPLRFRATVTAGAEETKGLYLDDIQVIEPM